MTYQHERVANAVSIRVVEVAGDGKWRVKLPGSQRASALVDSRVEAEARAREILRRGGGGELHIWNALGERTVYDVPADSAIPGRRQITRHPHS